LDRPYRQEFKRLVEGEMLQRLWSKDSSLWPADERQEQCLKANLGWRWELATALGCAMLNVNPFDEPDGQTTKERAAEILDGPIATGQLPSRMVRAREKGVELYAEAETRHQVSTLSLSDAFRTFFELREADGYLAIITYLGGDPHWRGGAGTQQGLGRDATPLVK
jgi:hypothetical protein